MTHPKETQGKSDQISVVGVNLERRALIANIALAASCPGIALAADDFPNKPIRLVAPFAAGSGIDLAARRIQNFISQDLGQSVIIENRVGAGGSLGTSYVAKAKPDGYTLLVVTAGTYIINKVLYKSLGYDPLTDFEPITRFSAFPSMLVVRKSLAVKSVRDLINLAKNSKEPLTYGSAGNGSIPHLEGALFKRAVSADLTHIPYQSQGAALTDVVAERLDLMFVGVPQAQPFLSTDKLRALAINYPSRSKLFPDLPTFSDAGVQGMEKPAFVAIFAPANTPKYAKDKIFRAIKMAMNDPGIVASFEADGSRIVVDQSVESCKEVMETEYRRWLPIIRDLGMSVT